MKLRRFKNFTLPRPSLFGRSLFLFAGEVIANATVWIVAGILFGLHPDTRSALSLCVLAWVRLLLLPLDTGVHAIDVEYLSAPLFGRP